MRRLCAGNRVWVAVTGEGDAPAGFAVAGPLGGFFHLHELSVDPAHGRRGLGAALVATVVAAAREGGFEGVSLSTFRFVPFNAPFYERLGFIERSLDAAAPALRDAFLRELPQGVDMKDRLLMVRAVGEGNQS